MIPTAVKRLWSPATLLLLLATGSQGAPNLTRSVLLPEVEEQVARYVDADNGAGPLWCYGAPLLVRQGELLFTSVMETSKDVPPLCNTRWRLYRRNASRWEVFSQAANFREREPCPLVLPAPNRLLLSVNPSTQPPGAQYGPCDPHLLRFNTLGPATAPTAMRPTWTGKPHFSDHSYRGVAADRESGGVLLLNIDATTSDQHWSYAGASGAFTHSGKITFPIRSAYPQVALRGRAAHVLAIADIVEPRPEWLAYKRKKTGQQWDYVFRRLFYTSTPDLTKQKFGTPVEVESVEAKGGHLLNLDLWLDQQGNAHLLYLKTNMTSLLRDRFFPRERISISLEYAQVAQGKVVARTTLVAGGESRAETPDYGRFHATEAGKLFLVYSTQVRKPDGSQELQNRLLPVLPRPSTAKPLRLALQKPFTQFFTATERGSSPPSRTLDLFGSAGTDSTLRYVRFRLP